MFYSALRRWMVSRSSLSSNSDCIQRRLVSFATLRAGRSKFVSFRDDDTPPAAIQPSPPESKSKAHESNEEVDAKRVAQYINHRQSIKELFPEGWNPPRKLSRDAMEGVRLLHRHDPTIFNTPFLAEKFRISPEAVRRILRSKWQPTREEQAKLLQRERRRKQEHIEKRKEKEKEEKRLALMMMKEKLNKEQRSRFSKNDGLSLR